MSKLKSRLAIVLSFVLAIGGILPGLGSKTAEAAPPILTTPDIYYGEGSGAVPVAPGLTLAGNGVYSDGYLKIALQDQRPEEQLTLVTVPQAVYGKGNVSIVSNATVTNAVYLGVDAASAKHVGDVIAVPGGYQINFLPLDESEAIVVGAGDFSDWTTIDHAVNLNAEGLASKTQGNAVTATSLGGGLYRVEGTSNGVPYSFISDTAYTKEGLDRTTQINSPAAPFSSSIAGGILTLGSDSNTNVSGSGGAISGSIFGPEALSSGFSAGVGDALAFDWLANGGGDHYEIYGFLVDSSNRSSELVYGRGHSQADYTTTYGAIPADDTFKFRFVAGSYDDSNGGVVGATLNVKNVRIIQNVPTDEVLRRIANLIQYSNSASYDDWETWGSDLKRTVQVEAQNINGAFEKDTSEFNINLEPQLKLESVSIDNAAPDQAALKFNLPIDGTMTPADFNGLTVNGLAVVGVQSIDGDTAVVKLANPVGPGALDVEYSGVGDIASSNSSYNTLKPFDADDLGDGQVNNGVEPLQLIDLVVDGNAPANKADLVFNKPVDGAGLVVGEPIPGFTIGGKPVTVEAIDGDTVSVSIDGSFEPGDKVAYTADGGIAVSDNPNNQLGDIDGGLQPDLTVTEDPLKLIRTEVDGDTPDQVKLTFNHPIDADSLDLSGFTVDGYAVDPDFPPVVNGDSVVLKLVEPVEAGNLTVLYDDEKGSVGSAFNPTTNTLGDITGADQAGIDGDNGVLPLELVKVSTDPSNPAQLKLKFNMAIAKGGLTPGEALEGFTVGGKPVKYVGINKSGDEIIVSLDKPYQAGDQLAYDAEAGHMASGNNKNNKLGDIAATDIPMVSGKLSGFGLTSGDKDLVLSPEFNPNKNNGDGEGYQAEVPNDVKSISISPTAYNPDDTITKVSLNGKEVDPADGGWDKLGELKEGPNEISVKVYDKEDPSIILEEYTVTVWRATGKLTNLVPSEGTLDPAFDSDTMDYEVNVGSDVDSIKLTPTALDPESKIEISVNGGDKTVVASGKASGDLELQTGENTIVVTVTDRFNKTVKTYTVTVNKASSFIYFPPADTTETITVDVVIGGDDAADITKVDIQRTKHADGRITDQVTFTPEKAQETVEKAKASGKNIARIVIPDPKDEVSEVNVDVPHEAYAALLENNIDLEIYTDNGIIHLPASSLEGLTEDFYFRLVPVKDPQERSEVEERAMTEQIVREMAKDDKVEVVTRPMTIETNLTSRPVTLTLPLRDVTLPQDEKERQAYLNELAIFIEHSDGDKEIVKGNVVTQADGKLGLQFSITKFSTFTIIQMAGLKGEPTGEGNHIHYVNGYPDGNFRPNQGVTRAEMAQMLTNLGAAGTSSGGAGFPDVAQSLWAADAISKANAAGLMEGYPNGEFQPNGKITRAEMATIVFNYLKLSEKAEGNFTDVAASYWANGIINAVDDSGLITGYPDGTFKPAQELSRAEAVTILNRLFDRGPLYGTTAGSWSDVPENHWAYADIEEASKDHAYIEREQGGEQLVAQ